jgi:hypothetical protein
LACRQYSLIALAIVYGTLDMQSAGMNFKIEDKPSICGTSNQQYLKQLS